MRELIEEVKQNITERFGRLTVKQKLIFFSSIVVGLITFGLIFLWSSQPHYTTVFTGLDEKTAATVVDKMTELGVPYQLDNNNTRISVPKADASKVRLEISKDGLIGSGGIGYEIFDQNNIGMTDFLQKVNYRRALQTEIARTIKSLEEVVDARVHIVIPDPSLFLEDKKEPTAAVTLHLRRNSGLSESQVMGLTHLISGSVEGLRPNKITIVDQTGRVLNKKIDEGSVFAESANQLQVKKNLENYLSQKAQAVLNTIVGYGNSIVQMNVELDFTKIDTRKTTYDPEGQVTRSEEVKEDETNQLTSTNQPSSTDRRSNTISNYEINETVERIIGETGRLKRLTVSVTINDRFVKKPNEEGELIEAYEKWPQESMDTFTELVKTAVGYSQGRGDEISVRNITFDPIVSSDKEEPKNWGYLLDNIGTKVLILIAALGAILLVRSIINTIRDTQARIEAERDRQIAEARQKLEEERKLLEADEKVDEEAKNKLKMILEKSDEMPEELLMRQEIHNRISEYIQEKPSESVSLLKAWILSEDD